MLTALGFAVETLDMVFKTAGVADTAAKIVDALADTSCLTTLTDLATSDVATPQEAQEFFTDALDLAFSCAEVAGAQIDVGPINKFLVEPILWVYNGISLALAGTVALTDLFVDLFTSSDGYQIRVRHELPERVPLDVSGYDVADFVAPNGYRCTLNNYEGTRAICEFSPAIHVNGVPAAEEEKCAERYIGLAGVEITDDNAWVCSGGQLVLPGLSSHSTDWFDETGFPPGPLGNYGFAKERSASLPVGEALRYGSIVCRALEDGVTCKNLVTEEGFTLDADGVRLTPS